MYATDTAVPHLQGLQYFNARLRMLEKRQQQIREIRAKHEKLKKELEDAKTRLMLDPSKWIGECKSLSVLLFNVRGFQTFLMLMSIMANIFSYMKSHPMHEDRIC